MYERMIKMKEKLLELSNSNKNVLTSKLLLDNGYTKYHIKKMVDEQLIAKVQRGIYVLNNELEDEFYINQMNNTSIVYSNETALYLHNMSDRYPRPLSVTTKSGYHIRNNDLKIYYTNKDLFEIGIIEINSPQGSPIKVYDKERTICDIIKNKNRIEPQVYIQGLQSYFLNSKPNLRKLSRYAKKMNIQNKVMDIVELYTKP